MNATHITCVTIAPLRAEASDTSEMVSQALFGELLTVLEEKLPWIKVRLASDAYEGWMDHKQVEKVEEEWVARIIGFGFVRDHSVSLLKDPENEQSQIHLTRGSQLPMMKGEEDLELSTGPLSIEANSEVFLPVMADLSGVVVAESREYLGTPYLWGGKTPWGIDCSGLTQMVFRMCGKNIARDASEQAKGGEEVTWGEHFNGDLAFFSRNGGNITHVGILTEDNNVIHASGVVREDEIIDGIIQNSEDKTQTPHKLICIRRYLTK